MPSQPMRYDPEVQHEGHHVVSWLTKSGIWLACMNCRVSKCISEPFTQEGWQPADEAAFLGWMSDDD